MKLNIRNKYLKELKKRGGTFIDDLRYRQDEVFGTIDTNRFTAEDLNILRAIAKEAFDRDRETGSLALLRKLDAWFKLQENPDQTKISNLDALVEAIRVYFKDTPHKWVFTQEVDGEMIPYYVVGAKYEPPSPRDMRPSSTTLELASLCRGKKETKNFTYHMDDIGVPLSVLLERRSLYRETPESVQTYEAECKRYYEVAGLTGEQFLAYSRGFHQKSYYDNPLVEMEVDGQPTRVVMDDVYGDEDDDLRRSRSSGQRSEEAVADARFWKKGQRKDEYEEEETEEDVVTLPTQPYVLVFDLVKHRHVAIHVNNIEPYTYDQTMVDKLILPEPDKDLVHILVQGADEQMEDIVKGKTGGIIVIATGPPGTGKTLTAETFSELVKRPLYSVQCSQLGTSPDKLEKLLQEVLNRAARWKAILLIDEADVYIHARGNDIEQNAIVGVWLRILEYYKGIMFMTSNRDTIIDDAIMSRATAWIRYAYPVPQALTNIWRVLAQQYQVTLTLETIEKLVRLPLLAHISGRTVKNLLKLARLFSKRKKVPITVRIIEYVSQYLDLEKEENACEGTAGRQIDADGGPDKAQSTRRRSGQTGMVLHVGTDA